MSAQLQLDLDLPPRFVIIECVDAKGNRWRHRVDERTVEQDCRDIEADLPGVRAWVKL